jgi:tetratricopeptide (TPR) repeat protein
MRNAGNVALFAFLCVVGPMSAQSPKATDLLQQADKYSRAGDSVAALKAYIDAVEIDPSVEKLDLIRSYQTSMPLAFMKTDEEKKVWRAEQELTNAALRMYVSRHPDDWDALGPLSRSDLLLDRPADAEKVLRGFLARHPDSVAAHRELVGVYSKEEKLTDAFSEAERLAQLPSCEPKDAALAGETANQLLLKQYHEPSPARTETLTRAEATLNRALERDPENFDALVQLYVLLRDRARTETDPQRAAALTKQADDLRVRARATLERREEITDPRTVSRNWGVSIVQGSHSQSANLARIMYLKRSPFTIKVGAPDVTPIGLNVFNRDSVERRIHEGFRFDRDCKPIVAFCGGTAFAEEDLNPRKALNVSEEGFHNLYHDSATDSRWNRVKKSFVDFALERDVAVIDDKPIEKLPYCRLFLTFVRRDNDSGVLRADEVIRIVLQFE